MRQTHGPGGVFVKRSILSLKSYNRGGTCLGSAVLGGRRAVPVRCDNRDNQEGDNSLRRPGRQLLGGAAKGAAWLHRGQDQAAPAATFFA